MTYPWKELSPKDPLTVRQTAFISDSDKTIVTFLYQPIIGPHAYSLYMLLLAEVAGGLYKSEDRLHADLLSTLGLGIPELYQARVRLEAIGLLNTYLKKEGDKHYLYEPCPPLTSKQFFEDDLMRLLLMEYVGENKLRLLQEKFTYPLVDQAHFQKITKSFLDVYDLSSQAYSNKAQALPQGQAYLQAKNGQSPKLSTATFDFQLLKQFLQKEFFNQDALTDEVQSAIVVYHHMYGLDEMAMANHLLRAANLETGHINLRELEKSVLDARDQPVHPAMPLQDKVMSTIEKQSQKADDRQKELTQAGYTPAEIALVLQSERMTPMAFINGIKKQKNGTVTSAEKKLVSVLLADHKLEPAVLNMLIYYSLVIQKHPTLVKNIVEAIANDWTQSNVTRPEQAIEKTKQFVGQKKAAAEKREENRSARYYGKNVVRKVEKLPDWAKDNQGPVTEELLPEDVQKKFNERLKKFRNSGKAGDS